MNVITILCDTLRRDHCGPYHQGRTVAGMGDRFQPDWVVPTPNMDRLAERGTVFDNAWCGSNPCMPARRDMYTGRYEFPFRGWGPLEDDDLDLPTQVSGPPNHPVMNRDVRVSQLVTDHFHLWERGSGNYHMGYSGFEFIRGIEADAWKTEPATIDTRWNHYSGTKIERHFQNVAVLGRNADDATESTYFPVRTFSTAADWIARNHEYRDFYLHIDSFSPHEPWDPPERLVKMFDPGGYDRERVLSSPPYQHRDDSGLSADDLRHVQALYAASVVHVDECLGMLWDVLDRYDLWSNTLVILTTDHGTFNGSRGRTGKGQTHLFDPIAHIPFIVHHPTVGHGERRNQLVQLVDVYPTTLCALNRPVPEGRHGVDLLPVLASPDAPTRPYAISGRFGDGMTITDGEWALHVEPLAGNSPLYWYSHHQSRFMAFYHLGPFECLPGDKGRRPVHYPLPSSADTLWLSHLETDPSEFDNRAANMPNHVARLASALVSELKSIGAPEEQLDRLGLNQHVAGVRA